VLYKIYLRKFKYIHARPTATIAVENAEDAIFASLCLYVLALTARNTPSDFGLFGLRQADKRCPVHLHGNRLRDGQKNLKVGYSFLKVSYVSRLERGLENPTVAVLEQLAEALVAEIVEFFAVPAPGEPPPKPLPGGRRPKRR
jgi:transcriptional regulator with XRE-family HTH domain